MNKNPEEKKTGDGGVTVKVQERTVQELLLRYCPMCNDGGDGSVSGPKKEKQEDDTTTKTMIIQQMGVVLWYGSWNNLSVASESVKSLLSRLVQNVIIDQYNGLNDCQYFTYMVQVDKDEESLKLWIGETNEDDDNNKSRPDDKNKNAKYKCPHHHPNVTTRTKATSSVLPRRPTCPSDLPVLSLMVVVSRNNNNDNNEMTTTTTTIRHAMNIDSSTLLQALLNQDNDEHNQKYFYESKLLRPLHELAWQIRDEYQLPYNENDETPPTPALKIFVAGDRSSVGKSSVSLGLLGSLLQMGYKPNELAYIKPATQSENLDSNITKFCAKTGIHCIPIGPIVYYRGFTRAFLAQQTPHTSQELLSQCHIVVEQLSRGKKIVILDGVGFPSVGSICGTCNARVAKACGVHGIVLVGGSGVGAAVDAYNLNSTYFDNHKLPVLGAIFNKLTSTEGFYSLEKCREQILKYFDNNQISPQRPFGFVPMVPKLATKEFDWTRIQYFIRLFADRVDVMAIVQAAARNAAAAAAAAASNGVDGGTMTTTTTLANGNNSKKNKSATTPSPNTNNDNNHYLRASTKRQRVMADHGGGSSTVMHNKKSRQDIERAAMQAGAPISA